MLQYAIKQSSLEQIFNMFATGQINVIIINNFLNTDHFYDHQVKKMLAPELRREINRRESLIIVKNEPALIKSDPKNNELEALEVVVDSHHKPYNTNNFKGIMTVELSTTGQRNHAEND